MNRILFACLAIIFSRVKAQDTLFFSNSDKLTVKLLEINPSDLVYKPFASQSAATSTVQKSELIKVVYANGVAEIFNNPAPKKDTLSRNTGPETQVANKISTDTIIFNGGDKISVKLTAINANEIKYKMSTNPDGPTYSVAKTEIKKIIFATGLVQQFGTSYGQDYDIASAGGNKSKYLYDKGKQDAIVFYKHKGGSVGVGCTALGCSPLIGLIPAVAAANSDPKRKNLGMPASAYSSNADYVNGYMDMAAKIKKRRVWTGFGIGSALYLAAILIINYAPH